MRESPRTQLPRAGDPGRAATRQYRAASRFHAIEARHARADLQTGPSVHQRPGAVHHRESLGRESRQIFLRKSCRAAEGPAAGSEVKRRSGMGDRHRDGPLPTVTLPSVGDAMNKSFFIILVPALLVAAGYVVVLRLMGIPPGYPRLIIAMVLFFGGIYWLSRRSGKKAKTDS